MTDLEQHIAGLSPQKRALLEHYLLKNRPPAASEEAIPQSAGTETSPLSLAQQRLWFLDQWNPGNPAYTIPVAVRLDGPLDASALEQSLNEIVRRHESLRTTFVAPEGEPVQVIAPAAAVPLSIADLRAWPKGERESELKRRITDAARQPFDLAHGPLFRASLLQLGPEEHVLLLLTHHIVSDGWSVGVLFRELGALYAAFSQDRPSPLPALPIQYADFSAWQRQWLQGEVLQSQLAYWKDRLADAPRALRLPTDRPRPAMQTFRGAKMPLTVSPALTAQLRAICRQEDATLFMLLLAALQALLFRYTGQTELVVGSPSAGRSRLETEGLIGFFINTLALRTDLSGDPPFRELLGRVRDGVLGALAHQDLPFEKLVEELQPERDPSYPPLVQVMFTLQNSPPLLELPGLVASPVEVESGTAQSDLTLFLRENAQGFRGAWEYNTDLFDAATIRRMGGHYQRLLEGIGNDPEQRISALPLLTEAEQRQLLVEWNDTGADYPADRCIHHLIQEQAARTPDAIAVICEDRQLTYGELNRRASRLARRLRALGVGPDVLVGICVERSLEMMVGLLGILKAGGAYLPLDPTYPRERLAFILADAPVSLLLTQEALVEALPQGHYQPLCIDGHTDAMTRESEADLDAGAEPDSLAYVIYTSGSTGRPKGVRIPHRAVVNCLSSIRRRPGLTHRDVLMAVTPLSFDIAALELFLPLITGARVVIVGREVALDGRELAQRLADSGATVMQATPATWRLLLEGGWQGAPGLKILCGGEALSRDLASELLPCGASLWNLYGPTETTIWSTVQAVEAGAGPIPIGRPLANTELYLLDAQLQPVPIGVPGELCIGGAGLARDYLGRPELTREKFIPHPFRDQPGARLYRTGDLARYRLDGSLEFVGRLDHQVKMRGVRVELQEIEAALGEHPRVRESVVVVREDAPGDQRLVAYVVSEAQPGDGAAAPGPTSGELRRFLREKLPESMVPSAFVNLEALPLTAHGKLDRLALPIPDPSLADRGGYLAPRSPVELQLTRIWETVLGVHPIGVRDNFFDLGGHSLLAVRLFAQIKRAWGKELPLVTLFQAPTVEQLAETLAQEEGTDLWSSLVLIQPGMSRPPLFCIHGIGGNVLGYRELARHLGPEQPVYGLQAQGLDGRLVQRSVPEMAAHYVREIRSLQPEGPYFLEGVSFGGVVAFEMARQIQAQGQEVALLALVDSFSPQFLRKDRWVGTACRIGRHLQAMRRLGPHAGLTYLVQRVRGVKKRVGWQIWKARHRGQLPRHDPRPRPLRSLEMLHRQAMEQYVPRPIRGRVTLFRARERGVESFPRPDMGWSDLAAGGVEIHEVPGNHLTMLERPHLESLAAALKRSLEEAMLGGDGENAARGELGSRQGSRSAA